ncbi:glycosyltransferase [Cryocola sp. 340MFSha3.1]|uniref:glycosyltransferase n=1 Tax=Cryocola sp. 340MFSha3.1 TaxID=1169145 RepID=UPI000376F2EA|nr:glycosyltransferase [Cryocola sp. 340MFSha3.1]
MYPRVTAIVVAHSGGPRLQRTLDALAEQTRRPDAVIAVDCATSDDAARLLSEAQPTQLLNVPEKLSFGAAVATAVRVLPPASDSGQLLWLLAQDTAPEPEALEALLAALEVSPSVAVVGPKLVDWDDPALIREFGEAMTPFGASVPLVENELDQAQHDGLSDVLAVSSAGMLVRQALWERLEGFDPALPTVDDGLDFCTRARLAGFRVTLVAQARIAIAGDGVAGPNLSSKWTVRRRLSGERRRAQLHRRMVYAPGWAVPLHWLTLVPLGILRGLLRLLRKEPGSVGGELGAAFRVAFSGLAVSSARRRLAAAREVSWAAVAPLRIPFAEVRRARALKREAAMVRQQGEKQDLDFFGTGGGWAVLAALLVGVALFFPLIGSGALSGGGLLPLDSSVGQLWADLGYGWRDTSLGFVGAADPFSAVLAVLGTLTFWQPSQSLVLLWVLAVPLAALGAWLAAARLTTRATLRAFAALAYALAPTLLVALQGGRPSAVLAHILLPWLFFAGLAARRSWAASATTALLAAATAACAPILIPALGIAWIAALVFAGRRAARIAFIPLPALVLFAPLVVQQGARGAWLSIFADPGVPLDARQTPAWQLALGFPDGTLGGWHALATALQLPTASANLIVPILLAPLGVLAILALFLRGTVRAIVALLVALVGFLTAVAALHVQVAVSGGTVVPIWPGTAVSLYWLGLIGAAVLALSAIGRAAVYPAWVAIVTLAIAVVPVGIVSLTGHADVAESDGRTMPAVVTAKAATQPRTGTLRIIPQGEGGIRAEIVRGSGQTLDDQSTLADTQRTLTADQRALAQLAGNLSSRSGYDASAELKRLGIDFVLLTPPQTALPGQDAAAGDATRTRAAVAMDANPLLAPVGVTSTGRLWAFDRGTSDVPAAAQIPADAGGIWRVIVLLVQGIVIGLTVLMAIPTTRSADRISELSARRPDRRRREEAAVEPDDEPEKPAAADSVADESLEEYEAEPDDEAIVESAEEEDVPEVEPVADGEPVAEVEPVADSEPVAQNEPVAEPEPELPPASDGDPEPSNDEAVDMGSDDTDRPFERETERVTTPPSPTTLEDGLEETIIRPRRSFEGGDRG